MFGIKYMSGEELLLLLHLRVWRASTVSASASANEREISKPCQPPSRPSKLPTLLRAVQNMYIIVLKYPKHLVWTARIRSPQISVNPRVASGGASSKVNRGSSQMIPRAAIHFHVVYAKGHTMTQSDRTPSRHVKTYLLKRVWRFGSYRRARTTRMGTTYMPPGPLILLAIYRCGIVKKVWKKFFLMQLQLGVAIIIFFFWRNWLVLVGVNLKQSFLLGSKTFPLIW